MTITSSLTRPSSPRPSARSSPYLDLVTGWLARYSVDILRVSLGTVFLVFGVLKFFPDVSPAQALVERTLDTLTLGVVSGQSALLMTAVAECVIGITLVTGKFLRVGLAVLAGSMVGIMSPLVLFFADMFADGGPTLEAQYVFKDIVLIAGGLVVASRALGASLVPSTPAGHDK